jgi:hypothetical protein
VREELSFEEFRKAEQERKPAEQDKENLEGNMKLEAKRRLRFAYVAVDQAASTPMGE